MYTMVKVVEDPVLLVVHRSNEDGRKAAAFKEEESNESSGLGSALVLSLS